MSTKSTEQKRQKSGSVPDDISSWKLSENARADLREILLKETDSETLQKFNDRDLDHLGLFLLTLFAEALKLKNEPVI